MEKMWRAVLATLFVAVMHFAWLIVVTDAYGAETVPYTSMWGDFKTAVPDGWKASYGNESTHYTDTNFKSPEPYYSLSIRWYTRFSTHRLSDDTLEMYGGVDDYIKQITES